MSLITFENVRKTYEMGETTVHALDGVDLTLEQGELVAIVGPSGSGKSTLMHIMGFLDRPTSGEVHFEGVDVSRTSERRRSQLRGEKIGFVFQNYNLLPRLNVLQNTLLPLSYQQGGKQQAREMAMCALEQVDMLDRIDHRPSQLSGGQQQRVAVARALINQPRILLADEPTGNLDSATASSILDLLLALNQQGRTIVLVTHDDEVAHRAQRQLRVRDGKIVGDVRT